MSKFNREKFKDQTKSSDLKALDKSFEDITRTGRGNYAGFLEIEDGDNRFLAFPSHELILNMMPENEKNQLDVQPFLVPKQVYWFEFEVEDKDDQGKVKKDGKGKPILKKGKKSIFDARVHSTVGKDIVDEYIKLVKESLQEEHGAGKESETLIREKMLPIYGSYEKRVLGIIGKPVWIGYFSKIIGDQKIFGRLEVTRSVKMRINELIAIEESNTPIGTESNNPFTHIDERRALIVKYNSNANDKRLMYTTEIDTSNVKGVLKMYPIQDDELEEFLKYPKLSDQYKNCYTQRDYDLALIGLRDFDDKNEYGVFESEKFTTLAEQLRDLYPAAPDKEESTNEVEEVDDSDVDEFELMDRNEMKKFNRENKVGLTITTSLSDESLRLKLREWKESQKPVDEVEEVDEEEIEESEVVVDQAADVQEIFDSKKEEKEEVKSSTKKQSTADKLAEARKKTSGK